MVAGTIKNFFRKYADYCILVILPLLLVLINSNWIFTPPFLSPDPWFYFANFRYFYTYVNTFPSNTHYFIERLTWNLPGYFIYHIFTPEVANYVLHLAVYYVAVFSLYKILKMLFNQRTALISALVLGGYPWFLRASGWDYVDGVGIAHMLLLLLLLLMATRSPRWKLYLFLAGIVHASLLTTNPFWIGFAPAWAAFFLTLNFESREIDLKQLFIAGCCFLAGNILFSLFLGLYYYSLTGHFNFLKNSMANSRTIASDPNNKKNVIEFYGKMPAYWHILPVLVALAAVKLLLKSKLSKYRYAYIAMAVAFALSYIWLIAFHFYSVPYLIIYLYSSFLIPTTFLLFGALIAAHLDKLTDKEFKFISSFVFLIVAAPLLVSTLIPSISKVQGNQLLIAVVTLAIFANLILLDKKQTLYLLFLGLSILFYLGGTNIDVFISNASRNRDNFLTLNDSIDEINQQYPQWKYMDFRFWFKSEESLFTNTALSSVYLYPWGSTIDMNPPGIYMWPKASPLKDGNIILVSSHSDAQQVISEANQALAPDDAALSYHSLKQIAHGDARLNLVFTKLTVMPIKIDYGKKFEFDRSLSNWGNWYTPEDNVKTYIWSGPQNESGVAVRLPSLNKDTKMEVCIISVLKPEILDSFKIFINDSTIPIKRVASKECPFLYSGMIQSKIISENKEAVNVKFQVDETVRPADLHINSDIRSLGLAFDWMEFYPVH